MLAFGFTSLLILSSCTSYVDKTYGPVDFELSLEDGDDMLFEGPNEGIITIPFKPEEYNIEKSTIGGMRLDQITLEIDNEEGFGIFENLKVEVSSEATSSLTIGVLNETTNDKKITIKGLEEAKIENFNQVDEFYLIIEGNLIQDLDVPVNMKGSLSLLVESSEKE